MLNCAKPRKFYCLWCFLLNSRQALFNTVRPVSLFSNVYSGIKLVPSPSKGSMIKNNSVNLINFRNKSKRQQNYDSDEDSDESDDEDVLGKGVESKIYNLESLRVDTILKKAFGYKRKFIEESFYKKQILVNGKVLIKKGALIKAGDVIDLVKGPSLKNENFQNAAQVEILKISPDPEDGKYYVKLMQTKSTMIESLENMKD